MTPKFRGGSDDWLDDQDKSHKESSKPKKKSSKATFIAAEKANATVVEVFPKQARVWLDGASADGKAELLCGYRRAQVIQNDENIRERTPVCVGDRVLVTQLNPQDGIIEGVCSRRNFLARPAPGKTQKLDEMQIRHVVAANVDLLVIVASVKQPDFSCGLIDRYLIAAQAAGIDKMICVSKSDLLEDPDRHGDWDEYRKIGFSVHLVSGKTLTGLPAILSELRDKTVVFCGHSGVGKTSLFRSILGKNVGKTGEVNDQTGKGRHTTTSSILYKQKGSNLIDTPGVREFGLIGVSSENLASYFPEFQTLQCTARGCSHIEQHDCQASELFRYHSFLRIHESLLEIES